MKLDEWFEGYKDLLEEKTVSSLNGRVQKYVTYLCSLFSSTMVSNL